MHCLPDKENKISLVRKTGCRKQPVFCCLFLILSLSLFIAISAAYANQPPQAGTITPSSITSDANKEITITATYIDPDGSANIKSGSIRINESGRYGIHTFYDTANNNIYLYYRRKRNGRWRGAWTTGTVGSNKTLTTQNGSIDCSKASVQHSGNTLTVRWPITLKHSLVGTSNIYLDVADQTNTRAGWTNSGTWTILPNQPPVIGTLTPTGGETEYGTEVIFTATCSDPNGSNDIGSIFFRVGKIAKHGIYAYYNTNDNKIYLYYRKKKNGRWRGKYASAEPGSNVVLWTQYGTINCANATVEKSGNNLTIRWPIRFGSNFRKTYSLYLSTKDKSGMQDSWRNMGSWTITPNKPPQAGTVSPSSGQIGINREKIFTTTYVDPNGSTDIKRAYFRIGLNWQNGIVVYYNRERNEIVLNTSWRRRKNGKRKIIYASGTPGSSQILDGAYCSIDLSRLTVQDSGNALTIQWPMTFKHALSGRNGLYLDVYDAGNLTTGWQNMGNYVILPNNPPQIKTITPSSSRTMADEEALFTITYADPDLNTDIKEAYFRIGESGSGGILAYYTPSDNMLHLYYRRRRNGRWRGRWRTAELGSSTVLTTQRGSINCANASVETSGKTMIIRWPVIGNESFAGTQNIYIDVNDNAGAKTGWQNMGSIEIAVENQPPQTGTISPLDGQTNQNQETMFTATYTDPNSSIDIERAYFRVGDNQENGISAYYTRSTNSIHVYDRRRMLTSGTPGSNTILWARHGSIDLSKLTVQDSGNTLTIQWPITFGNTLKGVQNLHLHAEDSAKAESNWSQVGTWTIIQVLSISLSPNRWNIGEVEPGSIVAMQNANKITVRNTGTADQDFILSITNADGWTPSSNPASETFVLNAAFASSSNNISWSNQNHLVTTTPAASTAQRFAGNQSGAGVESGETRSLFLRLKAPTKTQAVEPQAITLTISCEAPR